MWSDQVLDFRFFAPSGPATEVRVNDGKQNGPSGSLRIDPEDAPDPPADLVDFHLRWREFRPFALGALTASDLTPLERATIRWLVTLSDRVSDDDINS